MSDTATTAAAAAPRPLRELLETLPQELYDEIYNDVFTAPTKTFVVVDRYHKPPALLQVDRASRAKFAESYYARTCFFLKFKYSFAFIGKLQNEHANLLKDIRTRSWWWGRENPWHILPSRKAVRELFGDPKDIVLDLIGQGLVEARKQG